MEVERFHIISAWILCYQLIIELVTPNMMLNSVKEEAIYYQIQTINCQMQPINEFVSLNAYKILYLVANPTLPYPTFPIKYRHFSCLLIFAHWPIIRPASVAELFRQVN